jgi:hypothetical protein
MIELGFARKIIQANNDRTVMNNTEQQQANEIRTTLLAKYGPLMTSKDVVSALKLESVDALRMARKRRTLKLTPLPVHGRRSLLFSTDHVAHLAHEFIRTAAGHEETPM